MTDHPEALTGDLLRGIPHGFFTRRGGVSGGIFHSLNTGPGSSDEPAAVAHNRARVRAALGAEHLLSVAQVHSADVVTVTEPWDDQRPEADAMVTDVPGLALGVLTADCTPVLLADAAAGVVGAAHAGWKGAVGGVLGAVLEAMEGLGARRAATVAVLGPTISQASYEVGPEFVDRFLDEEPGNARFFAAGNGDRAQFDLPGYCLGVLRAEGIGEAAWTGHCTYADPVRFYSYRRSCHLNEPDYGRLIAAIRTPS